METSLKRSSFASRQIRAGPAPLASFEDLPSDELESPEEFNEAQSLSFGSAFEDESISQDMQLTTPDSLTISSQSTPRIECDFDSNFTLTPDDSYQGQPSSELRTVSLSSLSKDSVLSVKQKKGSAVSLGVETTEVESSNKKPSWTDLFRSNNQNSAKSSSSLPSSQDPSKKLSRKKSRELPKKDVTETKTKDKGKFLSIFKKKSNKIINSSLSSSDFIVPSENLNVPECLQDLPEDVTITKVSNGNVSRGKENEIPKKTEICSTSNQVQNDLGKINSNRNDKTPDDSTVNQKIINISEKPVVKEYNILSLEVEDKKCDQISKTENIQAIVEEEPQESSESASELPSELEKDSIAEDSKKEDDFEAQVLISHDLSEIEDDSLIELRPAPETPKQVPILSRQQRLEVTTKPIERPRSTTPINTAKLEAFIQTLSPSITSKVEKIKLSLPGEQFVGRVKSPKKSTTKSWTDFCESGLQSPRLHRKTIKDIQQYPFGAFDSSIADRVPFTDQDSNWAIFESNFEVSDSNIFGDNFISADSNAIVDQKLEFLDPHQPFEANFCNSECPCKCHSFELGGKTDKEYDFKDCGSCCQSMLNSETEFISGEVHQNTTLWSCDVSNKLDSTHKSNV